MKMMGKTPMSKTKIDTLQDYRIDTLEKSFTKQEEIIDTLCKSHAEMQHSFTKITTMLDIHNNILQEGLHFIKKASALFITVVGLTLTITPTFF